MCKALIIGARIGIESLDDFTEEDLPEAPTLEELKQDRLYVEGIKYASESSTLSPAAREANRKAVDKTNAELKDFRKFLDMV